MTKTAFFLKKEEKYDLKVRGSRPGDKQDVSMGGACRMTVPMSVDSCVYSIQSLARLLLAYNIRLLKLSTWGDDTWLFVTWQGSSEWTYLPHRSSTPVCLSTDVRSNYTHTYLQEQSSVTAAVQKILHLYLQPLNRGQSSTYAVMGVGIQLWQRWWSDLVSFLFFSLSNLFEKTQRKLESNRGG